MGKWLVCSAWPYINSVPHLGTFIHLVSADVYARYLKLKGEDVISVSGSDEHGTPIEVEAIKKGVDPKALCDKNHEIILGLLKKYRVELTNYTRTESPVHKEFVRDFYKKLYERGYVYPKSVDLLYCEKCERFLPDRFVVGTCPYCGYEQARGDQCENCGRLLEPTQLVDPRCAICGSRPKVRATKHWYFDLPRLNQEIKKYILSNNQLPENARNMSLRIIEEGLKARALTRDNKWGIPSPFPGSEGKTVYVWMEAVLGYLSAVLEWARRVGDESVFDKFWRDPETRSVYFIGKDNVPFHTIIFPALLIASGEGYVLPWQVSSTEYIMMDGMPFSKSKGIGVWMDEALSVADGDVWRFVIMYLRPEAKDANFTWREFERIVNKELNDNLGNFIHRVLTLTSKYFDGMVPRPHKQSWDGIDHDFYNTVKGKLQEYRELMDEFKMKDAAKKILEIAHSGNEYLSKKQPWELVKTNQELAANCIYISLTSVELISILLWPVMPGKSEELWLMLGKKEALVGHGLRMPVPSPGRKINEPRPLFTKVSRPSDLIRRYKGGGGDA